jgi:hypothetical protein
MSILPKPNIPIPAQPSRDTAPRRLIVTAGLVAFAIRDWSLWVLLRVGPWGPPMRLVLGNETVSEAIDRILDALLLWPTQATLFQLKAGWQEQQVHVWGSTENGSAISLMHSVLIRANRDELRPNLHAQPVPSLHVQWFSVADIESGRYTIDSEVLPSVLSALAMLRSHIEREPELILRYLADMGSMKKASPDNEWWNQGNQRPTPSTSSKATMPLSVIREPAAGDGVLTLAEATLLYRAFFPEDERVDLSSLRRRFLATNRLEPLDEDRPVRGREVEWRRVSKAYRYIP